MSAKYTLTLTETIALMNESQRTRYEEAIKSCGIDEESSALIYAAFQMKFRNREIMNGTPEGFVLDLEQTSVFYAPMIRELLVKYDISGYFTNVVKEREFEDIETRDLCDTDTYGKTNTRTPDLTVKSVFSDTPDTSGVVTGNYASAVTTNTSTGTERNVDSGTDSHDHDGTVRHEGSETRRYTSGALLEVMRQMPPSFLEQVLKPFYPCFMLIY